MEKYLKNYSRYGVIAAAGLLILVAIYMLKGLFISIITSAILAYLVYPIYLRINKVFKKRGLSAFTMIIIVLGIIIVPLFFIVKTLLKSSIELYSKVDTIKLTEVFGGIVNEETSLYLDSLVNQALLYLAKMSSAFVSSLPEKLLSAFVVIFLLYYFLKDGERIAQKIASVLPIEKKYRSRMIVRFKEVMKATMYGLIVVGLVQGIVGTIGLYIFGAPAPLFFGVIMTVAAMIPFLGTGLVWVPLSFYLLINGNVFGAIGLFLYGLLVVSVIDNFLRPKLMSDKAKYLHPIIAFIGIIGGLATFGFIGILLGPLILSIVQLFIEFYENMCSNKGIKKS